MTVGAQRCCARWCYAQSWTRQRCVPTDQGLIPFRRDTATLCPYTQTSTFPVIHSIMNYTSTMQTKTNGRSLPLAWQLVKLGDVCESKIANRDPRREPDSRFIYVDITSIDASTKTITDPKNLIGKDAPSRARQVIQTGDVIVSTTRPNLNAVAKVTKEYDKQICSTGFCVLRPNQDRV